MAKLRKGTVKIAGVRKCIDSFFIDIHIERLLMPEFVNYHLIPGICLNTNKPTVNGWLTV
jgi:hypothetical protein